MAVVTLSFLNVNTIYDSLNTNTEYTNFSIENIAYDDFDAKTQTELQCLADNIYHEARGEKDEGQIAVAMTTLNRLGNENWPNSICGVVFQKISNVCQFSWVCDKNIIRNKVDKDIYEKSKSIAVISYMNRNIKNVDITNGATFYHANYVKPRWRNLKYIKTIGNHLFYKV